MKKLIFTTLGVLGFATVNAQNTVTLNINLQPIQTLIVNNTDKVVNIDYSTKDHYKNGATSNVKQNQLSIYSTGGFQVKVKSSKAVLENGGKSIAANSIQIVPSAGTDPVPGAEYAQNVMLSSTESTLVTSTKGGVDKNISIEYKGAGGDAYLDNYIAGQTPTTYTTDLTYTILAK